MPTYLWFLLGAAIGSAVFGLLAWAEELKGKRMLLMVNDARDNEKKIYDASVQKLHDIYSASINQIKFELLGRVAQRINDKSLN